MKQILQSYRSGELWLADVPAPQCAAGGVVVRTRRSAVSPGTERALLSLARKSLIGKARSRPDLAAQVLRRMRTEGVAQTLRKVAGKLDEPITLGYSAAGEVVEAGAEAAGLAPGDRVAVAGAGYATHAQFNFVPRNLCAKIPDGVSFDDAAFATIGSIALQAVRQTQPQLGERIVVIGLGLLGLLAAQLLRANGCAVLGVDADAQRVDFAERVLGGGGGFQAVSTADAAAANAAFAEGRGADAVIVAAATKSSAPIVSAGEMSRAKGRVVVMGLVGMEVPRDIYYRKELDLRLSMSYGPGRYDPDYEERGRDYPFAYVRFTEQRNLETFLELVRQGRVAAAPLVSHRFAFDRALDAYALMDGGSQPYLGILLDYSEEPEVPEAPPQRLLARRAAPASATRLGLGVIGAGAFARGVLLPRLAKMRDADLIGVCTASGASAGAVAARQDFAFATTDAGELLAREDIGAVLIATRHGSHAALAEAALRAGKHVFVEKPLCLAERDLDALAEALAAAPERCLMVGFNRRFSPHAAALRAAFAGRGGPMSITYRVNAGTVPAQHWVMDAEEGGGRLIGEVCHFVDFCSALIGSEPVSVQASGAGGAGDDSLVATLRYRDGSLATIQYLAQGHRDLAKERCEVFADGRAAVLDDFRSLRFHGGGRSLRGRQDKGFDAELARFVAACRDGGEWPIAWEEIAATHRACFAAQRSLSTGHAVALAAATAQ